MFDFYYQKKRPSAANFLPACLASCLLYGFYASLIISASTYSPGGQASQVILAYELQSAEVYNKNNIRPVIQNRYKAAADQFRRHLAWLKYQTYTIWHLKDLLDWQAQGKKLPEKLAIIYFKPLNKASLHSILPILKQQKIKASVNLNHQWISTDSSISDSDTSDKKTDWSNLKQLDNLHWVNHIHPLSASNNNRSFSSKQLLALRNELFLNQSIIDFHFGAQGHIASYPANTLNHQVYQLASSNHYQLIDLREGYLEPAITTKQAWLARSLSPNLPLDEFKQLLLFKPLIISNIKTGNKNIEKAALVNASIKSLTRVKLSFDTPLSTAPTKTSCQLKTVSRINHKTDNSAAYSTSYTTLPFSLQHQTITELKANDIVLRPGGRHYDFSFTISQTDLDTKKEQTKNLNHLIKKQASIECLISSRYWFSYPI